MLIGFVGHTPYPTSHQVWRRGHVSFVGEERFNDLLFRDFVGIGRRMAARTLDHVSNTPNHEAILTRGLTITPFEAMDVDVATSIGYTSMVGAVLADDLATSVDLVWGTGWRYLSFSNPVPF